MERINSESITRISTIDAIAEGFESRQQFLHTCGSGNLRVTNNKFGKTPDLAKQARTSTFCWAINSAIATAL